MVDAVLVPSAESSLVAAQRQLPSLIGNPGTSASHSGAVTHGAKTGRKLAKWGGKRALHDLATARSIPDPRADRDAARAAARAKRNEERAAARAKRDEERAAARAERDAEREKRREAKQEIRQEMREVKRELRDQLRALHRGDLTPAEEAKLRQEIAALEAELEELEAEKQAIISGAPLPSESPEEPEVISQGEPSGPAPRSMNEGSNPGAYGS